MQSVRAHFSGQGVYDAALLIHELRIRQTRLNSDQVIRSLMLVH